MLDRIHGTAAGSLASGDFVRNGDVRRLGASAEQLTAGELVAVAEDGGTVLHDLRLPARGLAANVDHVVVSGDRVLLIDSKWWASGTYWSVGGRTRRGLAAAPHADKSTMELASRTIALFLARTDARVEPDSLLVVWGRAGARHHLRWYRPRGATAVRGDRLLPVLRTRMPIEPANPEIVAKLATLVKAGHA